MQSSLYEKDFYSNGTQHKTYERQTILWFLLHTFYI